MLVYLAMGVVLGIGVVRTVHGQPALLITGAVTYLLALGVLGCIPKKSHH